MADKATKDEADYQGAPEEGKRCAGCSMFRAPRECTAVEGKISPDGYCAFWEAKDARPDSRLDDAIKLALGLVPGAAMERS